MADLTTMTAEELREANQGCTELTCPVHWRINDELARRGEPRTTKGDHP